MNTLKNCRRRYSFWNVERRTIDKTVLQVKRRNECDKHCVIMLLAKPKTIDDPVNCCNEKMFRSTVDIPKHHFGMSMVQQLLLTLPVGSCFCEAVELSFSCLRRLKTWRSQGGRMVCGKGTTFTVSLPPLFCHTGCESDDDSEIFNFLHFRLTAQGGGAWPNWPNGKYAHGHLP